MSMTVRRHPRTMQEAFGPYTSSALAPMGENSKPSAAQRWMVRLGAVFLLVLILGSCIPR